MNPLEGVLIQSDGVPIRRGSLDTLRHQGCLHTEERRCEDTEGKRWPSENQGEKLKEKPAADTMIPASGAVRQ